MPSAASARRSMRCWRARPRTPSSPCARRAITPERARAMGFACFPVSRWGPCGRWTITGWTGWRSWISTSITATARRTFCGTKAGRCSPRPIRRRFIRALARASERGAHGQIVNVPLPSGGTGARRARSGRHLRAGAGMAAAADSVLGRVRRPCRRPAGQLMWRERDFARNYPDDLRWRRLRGPGGVGAGRRL